MFSCQKYVLYLADGEGKHASHATSARFPAATQVPLEAVAGDLAALGLEEASVKRLLEVMELRDMDGVEAFLGKESPAAEQVGAVAARYQRKAVGGGGGAASQQ